MSPSTTSKAGKAPTAAGNSSSATTATSVPPQALLDSPPPETTTSPSKSSDAAALAILQADYAALLQKINQLEASQSARGPHHATTDRPNDGMPSTINVPAAYMLKGRDNFVEWDGFLNMFLTDDVYAYLTGGRAKVNWNDTAYARGQEYASRVLIASIDPVCASDIIPIRQMKGTAHECWLELASRYRPSDAQAAATLVGEFWDLPPIPAIESDFGHWAGRLRIIVNSMRNIRLDFEQLISARLLLNMPPAYNSWRSTFNQGQAEATALPKIEDIIFSLRREVRSLTDNSFTDIPTYITRQQQKPTVRSQRPPEASTSCPVCDEGKHWADQCPDTERRLKYFELKSALRDLKLNKSATPVATPSFAVRTVHQPAFTTSAPATHELDSDGFFMSFHTATPYTAPHSTDFLLDSASPFHIVNDRSLFSGSLAASTRHIAGIGGRITTKGTGFVDLRTDRGALIRLNHVHFAPNAPANIISVFQMGSKGVLTSFTGGQAELSTSASGIFATACITASQHYRLNVLPASSGNLTTCKPTTANSSSRVSNTPNRFRLLATDVSA